MCACAHASCLIDCRAIHVFLLGGEPQMHRWCLAAACAVVFSVVAVPAASAKQRSQDRLDVYTVVASAQQIGDFEAKGLDMAEAASKVTAKGVKTQMILTKDQLQTVRDAGASAQLTRVKGGK